MILSVVSIIVALEMLCGYKAKTNATVARVIMWISLVTSVYMTFNFATYFFIDVVASGAFAITGIFLGKEDRPTYLPKPWVISFLVYTCLGLICHFI